jgi:hypothetical protein
VTAQIPQHLAEPVDLEDETEQAFVPDRKDMTAPLIP